MIDKPIIFSAPMVRALLDGRKSQTRRLLKLKPPGDADRVFAWFAPPDVPTGGIPNQWAQSGLWAQRSGDTGYNRYIGALPYRPRDRLYVREAYFGGTPGVANVIYRANGEVPGIRWRPSIHMPRWVSRLTLIVTEVRVQRLQDISEADAIAEGVTYTACVDLWSVAGFEDGTARGTCRLLWNSLYTTEGERWEDNPWIVALTFDVIHANIDQVRA